MASLSVRALQERSLAVAEGLIQEHNPACGESAGLPAGTANNADAHVAVPDMDTRAACQGIN